MSSNVRKSVSEIQVGDVFKSKWNYNTYEIAAVLDEGKWVVYKKPSGSGYGVTEGLVFLRTNDYKLVVPFFEKGAKYQYINWQGKPSGNSHEILHVQESNGKMVALYVEIDGEDRWHGAFTENDFKNYKKVSA